MPWSEQQEVALLKISDWYRDFRNTKSKAERRKKQVFRLFGVAGSGKSTLAFEVENIISGRAQYGAFTGKATMVMREKGCYNAETLHSLIYRAVVNEHTGEVRFVYNSDSIIREFDILIVDECSMVDDSMAEDILSYGVPVLVLGDPNQLPPVGKGEGFFTRCLPDYMLTEIHRQAADNPIIYLSKMIRENVPLKKGSYGNVIVTDKMTKSDLLSYDQIITGRVATRKKYNEIARGMLERTEPHPVIGEKIIGIKNDREVGVFNGLFYYVEDVTTSPKSKAIMMKVRDDFSGKVIPVKGHRSHYDSNVEPSPEWRIMKRYQEFDYAYAITCHKAQGSQFSSLLIKDESYVFRDSAKNWLYTAVTRASTDRVKIVVPK